MDIRRNFRRRQAGNFAYPFQIADNEIHIDVLKTFYFFYTTKKMPYVAEAVKKVRFVGSNSQVYYNRLHQGC